MMMIDVVDNLPLPGSNRRPFPFDRDCKGNVITTTPNGQELREKRMFEFGAHLCVKSEPVFYHNNIYYVETSEQRGRDSGVAGGPCRS